MFCPECKAEYRRGFTRCSDCDVALVETLPDEPELLSPGSMDEELQLSDLEPSSNPITCPRCERELDYVGTKHLHEGTNWGALGEIGEFFVDGIGEEFRPR